MAYDNFIMQLHEDIKTIQDTYIQTDLKLENDWYAFNYWILNYLYHVDIENITSSITEYNDKGIDCFVHYEDTKELYIIQNVYYKDSSNLKRDSISDFLVIPLHSLSQNTYKRSSELQTIFNKIKDDGEYTIYLYLYTTKNRNSISNDILSLFDDAPFEYKFSVETKLVDINEIKNIYYGNRFDNDISFEYDIQISKKDLIDQTAAQHDKENNVDTAYVAINVYEIYKMLEESNNIGYSLFDKNIREYLGITGKRGKTNKDIKKTLLDPIERNRFFYYNNGITMICDDFHSYQKNKKTTLTVSHPQIVNGCQTVNTIFYTIKDLFDGKNISEIATSFKHCSILVKIFKINKTDDADLKIYENIVKYTNTQTSITAKDFVSKDNYFLNLQEDFLKRGFYLIVKQSDKHKFESDEQLFEQNKKLAIERCAVFDIQIKKPKDLFIELDKLLKVFVAFYFDGYTAYKNGSSTMKENSSKYYIHFSKNIREFFTTDNMINLFLIYVRANGLKVARTGRYPIPYYFMDLIGRYIKSEQYNFQTTNSKLSYLCSSKEIFEEVYNKFYEINEDYGNEFMEINDVDYSTMTKNREIDAVLLNRIFEAKKREASRNNWTYFIEYTS